MKAAQPEECILCCRDIKIYATGTCDHPVCYECSTRMRVLCETNECPVCRSNMPVVVFTHQLQIFSNVSKKFALCNKKYQIIFENEIIAEAFDQLLENRCKLCDHEFPTFDKLKEHVRRIHELHYCELCTDNLRIFTFERKSYSRKDLARHKRHGDPDEKSHRGHPLCEFCDQRYVDSDDLFRHLRKEHFFCHFCDADGMYQYYKDYEYLRNHFRKEHYLCEEGNCISETFTSAFRSEIDLKAHIAVHHSKNKSKAEAKQARMLDFEFAYVPHTRPTGSSSPRGGRYAQSRRRNIEENVSQKSRNNQQPEPENLNTHSVQEFPYLSEDSANKTTQAENTADTMISSLTLPTYTRNPTIQKKNVMSVEDFPALSSASSENLNNQNKMINFSASLSNNATVQMSNLASQKNIPNRNIYASSEDRNSRRTEMESGDRISQQKSKWMAKKADFNFEEEFPTLEVKKNPPTFAPVSVPKMINSIANKVSSSITNKPPNSTANKVTSSTLNNNPTNQSLDSITSKVSSSNTEPTFGDQFVVIKTKSKKKRQNRFYAPSDFDVDEESSKAISNNKVTMIENDKEKDLFKNFLSQPTTSTRSGNVGSEDIWREEASFGNEDFPPLAPSEPVKKPPGLSVPKSRAPPPGFTTNAVSNPVIANKTLSDVVREIVLPNKVNGVKKLDTYEEYKEPQNFKFRNDELIKKIYDLSSAQAILFDEFKTFSGKFRRNEISASVYHAKCLNILGEKGVLEIFPELVSLLPDIKKQQELLTVHKMFLSHMNGGAISKKAARNCNALVTCEKCNQVLEVSDCKNHELLHSREHSQ